jgi:hypothetical protein
MPIAPRRRARMPPRVLRYETPPTMQPAPQNPPTAQTPHRRADENPSGTPTAHSQYRATTPLPANNRRSQRRNADQPAALPPPRHAHAPTAEAARPAVPRPPTVRAALEPRSHQPAYEPHRNVAVPTPHPHTVSTSHVTSAHPVATCGLRFAPYAPVRWRSRPRRSLRFALRPPPQQQPPATTSACTPAHRRGREVRAAADRTPTDIASEPALAQVADTRRALTPLTCGEEFLYWYQAAERTGTN